MPYTLNPFTGKLDYYQVGTGSPGPTGPAGSAGATIAGADGEDGVDGVGIPGATGPQGLQGIPGAAGLNGAFIAGSDGEDGQDGMSIAGPQGPAGQNGVTTTTTSFIYLEAELPDDPMIVPGQTGAAGSNGTNGIIGVNGAPGVDGVDGEDAYPIQGPAGAAGQNGAPGITTTNFVFSTLDADPPDDPIVIPGPQGPQGTSGGGGATIKVATITVPYGLATYSGTVTDASVLVTSNIILGWGSFPDTATNDPEMDDMLIHPEGVVAGAFNIEISNIGLGTIGGPFTINYLVG